MTTFEHYWTLLNTIEHYRTLLNTIEHYWTLLNTIEHYWTLLNTIEHYWTLYRVDFLTGPPDFQYQNEKKTCSANEELFYIENFVKN